MPIRSTVLVVCSTSAILIKGLKEMTSTLTLPLWSRDNLSFVILKEICHYMSTYSQHWVKVCKLLLWCSTQQILLNTCWTNDWILLPKIHRIVVNMTMLFLSVYNPIEVGFCTINSRLCGFLSKWLDFAHENLLINSKCDHTLIHFKKIWLAIFTQ